MVHSRQNRRNLHETLRGLCRWWYSGRHRLCTKNSHQQWLQGMGRMAQKMQRQTSSQHRTLQTTITFFHTRKFSIFHWDKEKSIFSLKTHEPKRTFSFFTKGKLWGKTNFLFFRLEKSPPILSKIYFRRLSWRKTWNSTNSQGKSKNFDSSWIFRSKKSPKIFFFFLQLFQVTVKVNDQTIIDPRWLYCPKECE